MLLQQMQNKHLISSKATDIHISVAYFFSVDYVVDIVEVYPANILYKKKLALVYTKRNLLILIR